MLEHPVDTVSLEVSDEELEAIVAEYLKICAAKTRTVGQPAQWCDVILAMAEECLVWRRRARREREGGGRA